MTRSTTEVLSPQQIDQFIQKGWLRVEEAIPRGLAMQAQAELWTILNQKYGISPDRATWARPFYQLSENYNEGVFRECSTARLESALVELLGRDRFQIDFTKEKVLFGWWPINLCLGATEPWDVPAGGWHWDGMHFRHFVDSAEQGLLMIVLFSDVGPRGGGTLVAEGTHQLVARFLERHPDGIDYRDAIPLMSRSHPWLAELTESFGEISDEERRSIYVTDQTLRRAARTEGRIRRFMDQPCDDADAGVQLRVAELTGRAGDVILCHPFLYHAGSQNHSSQPRLMCNLNVPLKEKMQLFREEGADHSVLERSVRHALRIPSERPGVPHGPSANAGMRR